MHLVISKESNIVSGLFHALVNILQSKEYDQTLLRIKHGLSSVVYVRQNEKLKTVYAHPEEIPF